MKKRILSMLLALVMVVGLIPAVAYATEGVQSDWPSFRGNARNNGVTSAQTPRSAEEAELQWASQQNEGWNYPGNQILVNGSIYVMVGSELRKLDPETGEMVKSAAMAGALGYSTNAPLYADGMIFCAGNGGNVQAFDAETLESLWVYTDELGGQAQTPLYYSDGYLYTGFWNSATKDGAYICLSVKDGSTAVWRDVQPGGFYWAGAVVCGDYVIYGTDNGHLFSRNKTTGELADDWDLTDTELGDLGKVRSTPVCVDGQVYFTAQNGFLCRADVSEETGALSNQAIYDYTDYGTATSTPVVYDGLVYFGMYQGMKYGTVLCADANTLEEKWAVAQDGGVQGSLLLSDAYLETGYVYIYTTYNNTPGGVNVIKASTDGSEASCSVLFDASGYENYCVGSLIAGPDGTLYYKNDSGNVFALGMTEEAKAELKEEAENRAAANAVIAQINAIGTVTLHSRDAIEAARAAYDALTEAQKALVSNYEILTAAEARLEELETNPAAPAEVCVTISNAGEVVMAQEKITVADHNGNGFLDVDDTLWAAHETAYPGGAAAGYASEQGAWGLSITMLWGDTSFAYGYWLNNASCWSLEDAVKDGDQVVAFVYQDGLYWSDIYTKFGCFEYPAEAGSALTVTLDKAGYDENWNTVFTAWSGAEITVSDAEGNVVDTCTLTDNGDGTYTVTFENAGSYCLVAGSSTEAVVPAVCTVTVKEKTVDGPSEPPTEVPDDSDGPAKTGDVRLMLPLVGLILGTMGLTTTVMISKKRQF